MLMIVVVDNVVLMSVLEENGNVKLLGLDWDNWGVKVVGDIGVLSNGVTVREKYKIFPLLSTMLLMFL